MGWTPVTSTGLISEGSVGSIFQIFKTGLQDWIFGLQDWIFGLQDWTFWIFWSSWIDFGMILMTGLLHCKGFWGELPIVG